MTTKGKAAEVNKVMRRHKRLELARRCGLKRNPCLVISKSKTSHGMYNTRQVALLYDNRHVNLCKLNFRNLNYHSEFHDMTIKIRSNLLCHQTPASISESSAL